MGSYNIDNQNWYKNTYLKSDHWQQTRARKKENSHFRCELCGASSNLQIHHLHYKSLWHERDEDLECLCKDCHEWQHYNLTWEEIEQKIKRM